ncbi:MAG TPA: hypothetical protein PLV92_10565, partial [Pirellulaceae bacterium]|nr:hypothetical protein [Pirellulaceae bacterium]
MLSDVQSWSWRRVSGVCAAIVVLAAMIAAVGGRAVEAADLQSGPEPGSAVPALKVLAATGDKAGQEVDFPAERKDKVTVYAFIQADQFDR